MQTKKLKKVLPTEEDIKLYEDSLLQDENTKEEDKIVIDNELKAALTFYYEPVKQFFHSDDRISLGLIDYRASVINSGDISFVDTNLKAKFDIINDALKKSTLETLEEGE